MAASYVEHPPYLAVIDPQAEKVWTVTEKDGLPGARAGDVHSRGNAAQTLRVAPLGPGRVCVAGSFGRSWVALVMFAPGDGGRVRLVLEAPETLADAKDPNLWKNTRLSFVPSYCFTVRGAPDAAGKATQRVLLGRRLPYAEAQLHPLVIDPENSSVAVVPEAIDEDFERTGATGGDGAVYHTAPNRRDGRYVLVRRTLPDLKAEVVVDGVPDGRLLLDGDPFLILGEEGCYGRLGEGVARARNHGKAMRSSHYGILLWGSVDGKQALHQLDLSAAGTDAGP